MGWTSYQATKYKSNGSIDRKAECDSLFNSGNFKVLKSCLIGAVYYAAIKNEEKVFAVVCLTSVYNSDPYFNFAYKDMDETMGPYYFDCPKSILNLLTETDNECAKEWRAKCLETIEQKKKSFLNLPIGTTIQCTIPFNTNVRYKAGDTLVIKKVKLSGAKKACWTDGFCRFTPQLAKYLDSVLKGNYIIC